LVRDFRPEHPDGLLLLTALHVLQGCKEVDAVAVGCKARATPLLPTPWSAEHPVELLLWSEYDLIAVVVPPDEQAAMRDQLRVFAISDRAESSRPPYHSDMTLVAKSRFNPCPRIPAMRRDIVSVRDLYRSLDESDYYRLFGSLSADAMVMSYQSTAVEGTSGGPVLWFDDKHQALIAVHLGGQAAILQWGVLLAKHELLDVLQTRGAEALSRLDPQHPTVDAHGFSPPRQLTSADMNAELDLGLHRDSFFAMLESSTPVDPFGAVSNSLQLGWTHQWASLPFAPFDTSFGSRLSVAGMTGLYRSPVFFGEHMEDPLKGSAKLPFMGGFLEADAEVHFARLAPVHYVAGLGLRAGLSYLPDVVDTPSHVVWGPVLYGRAGWRWNDRLSGIAQLHLTVERIPVGRTPLDCLGPSQAAPSIWDIWGGIGVGLELAP
jgi:hypothetical protein